MLCARKTLNTLHCLILVRFSAALGQGYFSVLIIARSVDDTGTEKKG